jgi:ATP-dependent Lhr-like helicase
VTAGLVTADGFENLRALIDPKRRRGEGRARMARPRHAPGRWARIQFAPIDQDTTEVMARQLLLRWGVLFRDILRREPLAPPWRELVISLRRMEARGEIRGGRFLSAFIGEQYALPEAVDLLRSVRRKSSPDDAMTDDLMWSGLTRDVTAASTPPSMSAHSPDASPALTVR